MQLTRRSFAVALLSSTALAGCAVSGGSTIQSDVSLVEAGLNALLPLLSQVGVSAATIAQVQQYVSAAAGAAQTILAAVNPSGTLLSNFADAVQAVVSLLTGGGLSLPTSVTTILADVVQLLPLILPLVARPRASARAALPPSTVELARQRLAALRR